MKSYIVYTLLLWLFISNIFTIYKLIEFKNISHDMRENIESLQSIIDLLPVWSNPLLEAQTFDSEQVSIEDMLNNPPILPPM